MEQEFKVKQKDYEKASRLLGQLFEVDSDITGQINTCIQQYGISRFFKDLETFDFSGDVLEKLQAVRMVLFGIGEDAVADILKNGPDLQEVEKPKEVKSYEEEL